MLTPTPQQRLAAALLALAQKRGLAIRPVRQPYPVKDVVSVPLDSTPLGMNAGMALTGDDLHAWYRGH